jgi:hypothetical protein
LGEELTQAACVARTKRTKLSACILPRDKVQRFLQHVSARPALLLDWASLRLTKFVILRVTDLTIEELSLTMRGGDGGRSRTTMVPVRAVPTLQVQLRRTRLLFKLARKLDRPDDALLRAF